MFVCVPRRIIPIETEFSSTGLVGLPLRESMLRFSHQLINAASQGYLYSHRFAGGSGVGNMENSGVGALSRSVKQLQEIAERGQYVKEPIPRSFIWWELGFVFV